MLDSEILALDSERLALDSEGLALDSEGLALDSERAGRDSVFSAGHSEDLRQTVCRQSHASFTEASVFFVTYRSTIVNGRQRYLRCGRLDRQRLSTTLNTKLKREPFMSSS